MDSQVVGQVLQTLPSATPKIAEARTEVTQFLASGFGASPAPSAPVATAPSTNNAMPPIPQLPQMRK